MNARGGFSLIEVLIASVVLTLGMLSCLMLFSQSQKMMLASQRFEIAQRVLSYGEMLHPIPDSVTDADPEESEILNVTEVSAQDLADDLELELSYKDRKDLEGYTFKRTVDEPPMDDEEFDRIGKIYTIRTVVTWGRGFRGEQPETETVVKLWRNKNGTASSSSSK